MRIPVKTPCSAEATFSLLVAAALFGSVEGLSAGGEHPNQPAEPGYIVLDYDVDVQIRFWPDFEDGGSFELEMERNSDASRITVEGSSSQKALEKKKYLSRGFFLQEKEGDEERIFSLYFKYYKDEHRLTCFSIRTDSVFTESYYYNNESQHHDSLAFLPSSGEDYTGAPDHEPIRYDFPDEIQHFSIDELADRAKEYAEYSRWEGRTPVDFFGFITGVDSEGLTEKKEYRKEFMFLGKQYVLLWHYDGEKRLEVFDETIVTDRYTFHVKRLAGDGGDRGQLEDLDCVRTIELYKGKTGEFEDLVVYARVDWNWWVDLHIHLRNPPEVVSPAVR